MQVRAGMGIAVALLVLVGVLVTMLGSLDDAPPAPGAPEPRPANQEPVKAPPLRVADGDGIAPAAATGDKDRPADAGTTPAGPGTVMAEVTGTVEDRTGAPIGGARIRLIEIRAVRESPHPPALIGRTDARGAFCIDGVTRLPHPKRSVYVVADAPGYHRAHQTVPLDGDVRFVLDRPGRLTGRVTVAGDGAPCIGVRVAVEGTGLAEEGATTDNHGVYRLDGLRPGDHRVAVTSEEYPPLRWVTVAVTAGRETVADIALPRGHTLHGRVVDAVTRVPLRGASVRAFNYKPDLRFTETDASGEFRVKGLRPGTTLTVRADAFQTLVAKFSVRPADGSGAPRAQEFGLTRAARLEGRVLAPDGSPVPDAEVVAHGRQPWPQDRTRSGDDGGFALSRVPTGIELRVVVRKPGLTQALSEFMNLRPGESRRDLVLRLGRGATIQGRVTDRESAPVVGARLFLKPTDWTWHKGHDTTSDDGGDFRLAAVPAGTYHLEVTHEAWVGQRRPDMVVAEGVGHADVVFVLDGGLTISGQVVDQAGRAVERVSVRAHPLGSRTGIVVPQTRRTMSNSEGRFTLRSVAKGRYRLVPVKQGYRRKGRGPVAVAGDRDVVLTVIREHPGIVGVVRDAASGAPVTEFTITMHVGSNRYARGRRFSDRQGRFELPDLSPGLYVLEARTGDGRVTREAARVELVAGARPEPVELQLVPGCALEGRVLDPAGRPAARALFELRHASSGTTGLVGRGFVDADGRFTISALLPGAYRLRATHREWVEVEHKCEVRREGENSVEVRLLEDGGVFEITVRDAEGRPVEGASHILWRPNGEGLRPDRYKTERFLARRYRDLPEREREQRIRRYYSTDAEGIVERGFVPPGRYSLEVRKRGYRSSRVDVEALVGERTRVSVTLAAEK